MQHTLVSLVRYSVRHVTTRCLTTVLLVLVVSAGWAGAQPMPQQASSLTRPTSHAANSASDSRSDIFYTIVDRATLFQASDTTRAYMNLRRREPLTFLPGQDPGWEGWRRVRTFDGANGLIRSEDVSNVWLRISKTRQTLFVYRGANLIARIPTDLGYNFFSDKERRGSNGDPDHWRTPEGEFFIASKNPNSQFYRAFVLNYPNAEDAARGLEDGLITEEQYEQIVRAEQQYGIPPMNTELGGWIEIHGNGTGQRNNWTQGCVAIQDIQMDRLWDLVDVGTPVLIDP